MKCPNCKTKMTPRLSPRGWRSNECAPCNIVYICSRKQKRAA